MVKWSSKFFSVLVVGDKPLADQCCHALQSAGYESYAAYSGLSGFTMAKKRQPEVILLDLAMPDMDGIDLANAIRSSGDLEEMLLIALYDEEDDPAEYCVSRGVAIDRYLVKPIDLPQLADLIQATWRLTREGPFSKRKIGRRDRSVG
jgi:two-component system alkaline phosphatase synthesis response regulator PhoP